MNTLKHHPYALLMMLGLLLAFLVPVHNATAQDRLSGDWEGHIDVQGNQLAIQTHFGEAGDSTRTGHGDIPQQGAQGLQLVDIAVAGDSVSFRFNAGTGMVLFDGEFSGDTLITGTFHQAGLSFPFRLTPASGGTGGEEEGENPREPAPYRTEELSVTNGPVTLAGTLTLPESTAPAPCVVLLSGSGPQNRDEEIFGFGVFQTIADHLTRNGIAVYRYDDRGVDESTGSLGEAGKEELESDVRAIVSRLKEHPGVDSERIGLMGHSQGGIIAGSVAAAPDPPIAFAVLMASPTRTLSDVVVEQVRTLLEQQGAPRSLIEEQTAMQEAVFDTLRRSGDFTNIKEWMRRQIIDQINALPESSRAAIPDPEQYASNQVNRQIDVLTSPSYATFLDYDPKEDLRRSNIPVLALFGGKDTQIQEEPNVENARSALAESGVSYSVEVFPDANHLFQHAETGVVSEYATLEHAFVDGFLERVSDWIRSQTSSE